MGRKENPLVWYCNHGQNFAELIDGWLFGGKGNLCAEDFRSEDRRFLIKNGRNAYRERYRDIFKSMNGMGFCLWIGTEHQEHVHYAMPVRVMDYDGASYAIQRDFIRRRHEAAQDLEDTGERLSGFSKSDRLTPVITLILYCGSRPWDGACRLRELLDLEHVPQELLRYVADYRIHVLDICHTPDRRLREFPPDIRTLFLFMKYRDDPEKLKRCMAGEPAIRRDTYDTIADVTGGNHLKKIRPKEKGGKINMCKAIDILIADGEKRGMARERKNTERALARAEREKQKARRAKADARRERQSARREQKRAEQAEQRVRELEQLLRLKDALEKQSVF